MSANERLLKHLTVDYQLKWLQKIYGRKQKDVTRTVPKKKQLKTTTEWQRRAIDFVKRAYKELGQPVTVRQIHYYLVGLELPDYRNDLKHYNKLVDFILKARIVGELDWGMITETESLMYEPIIAGVTNIDEAINKIIESMPSMGKDPWDEINKYIYVFTEKRELFGQINSICAKYYVPLISFKGYGAVWTRISKIAPKIKERLDKGQEVWALVISDHDPSGLDINRFYMALLKVFHHFNLNELRVALTAKQIVDYNLPPNPAKETDPRFKWYNKEFGDESWEVDALVTKDIKEMQRLLEEAILKIIGNDIEKFNKIIDENKRLADEVKNKIKEKMGGS
jgi:uncharacterized protein (DUF2249 family)